MRVSRFTLAAGITAVVAALSLFAGRAPVMAAPPSLPARAAEEKPLNREMPAPKNLKVLPRNLTGEQVRDIMEQWTGELGARCSTCHTADSKNIGSNGKTRLNFSDDSKEEKRTARRMFKMVEDINTNYIAKIDSSGAPVTCGTCHRGHLGPEPYIAPEYPRDHDHTE
jgi:Photosynthetic reaction centre cytochrome C subunit